ncbi:MAG: DUF424 family protein [Halobacteriota archaeon]|nr:DUF424 family protein [Halobacteriota archaeon]
MMYLKRYETESDILVVVCDRKLIGKKFKEDELVLDVSEEFYKGVPATDKEVIEALDAATIANLVGDEVIRCAIDNGFIDECAVIKIGGVPHAQMIRI